MNYTSIEQSKHLLELGLKAETADMYYDGHGKYPRGYAQILIFPNSFEYDLPCWSVGALEDIIWKSTDGCVDLVYNWWAQYFIRYGNSKGHTVTKHHSTIIDACYELTCWLLQNNYIKTK